MNTNDQSFIQQRDIFRIDLNPIQGSEQSGIRPCVVVSGNAYHVSAMVLIIPLTTQIKNYVGNIVLDPHTPSGLDYPSEVLVGQIRAVSQKRLLQKLGEISQEQLENIFKGFDIICDR